MLFLLQSGCLTNKSYLIYYNTSVKIYRSIDIIEPIIKGLKKVDSDFHPPQIYGCITNEEIEVVVLQKIK